MKDFVTCKRPVQLYSTSSTSWQSYINCEMLLLIKCRTEHVTENIDNGYSTISLSMLSSSCAYKPRACIKCENGHEHKQYCLSSVVSLSC